MGRALSPHCHRLLHPSHHSPRWRDQQCLTPLHFASHRLTRPVQLPPPTNVSKSTWAPSPLSRALASSLLWSAKTSWKSSPPPSRLAEPMGLLSNYVTWTPSSLWKECPCPADSIGHWACGIPLDRSHCTEQ